MKALCLNVRSGGGQRWQSILDFVDAHGVDVIVFTEWRSGMEGSRAKSWASSRSMRWACTNDGATRNGVFVAAREDFEAESRTPSSEIPGALLRLQFNNWTMLACYFPQDRATWKRLYFETCRNVAGAAGAMPFLMMGDLNTGNQLADKTPLGTKYVCSKEFNWLSSVHGLTDLWRHTHGEGARQYTWKSKPWENEFRLDHAFGNRLFVERFCPSCRYDHAPREIGFGDHSAAGHPQKRKPDAARRGPLTATTWTACERKFKTAWSRAARNGTPRRGPAQFRSLLGGCLTGGRAS